jgi:hypothetical protein
MEVIHLFKMLYRVFFKRLREADIPTLQVPQPPNNSKTP